MKPIKIRIVNKQGPATELKVQADDIMEFSRIIANLRKAKGVAKVDILESTTPQTGTSLYDQIEEEFNRLQEMNATANMDGGEGPPSTPNAFLKGQKHFTHHKNRMEVLGYELVDQKKNKTNTPKGKSNASPLGESTFMQMAKQMHGLNESLNESTMKFKPGDKVEFSFTNTQTRKSRMVNGIVNQQKGDLVDVIVGGMGKSGKIQTLKANNVQLRESNINEVSYQSYKKDESMTSKAKINNSISELNKKLYEMERIIKHNSKLKVETGVNNSQYWKSTTVKFGKISERMLRVAKGLRELKA